MIVILMTLEEPFMIVIFLQYMPQGDFKFKFWQETALGKNTNEKCNVI